MTTIAAHISYNTPVFSSTTIIAFLLGMLVMAILVVLRRR